MSKDSSYAFDAPTSTLRAPAGAAGSSLSYDVTSIEESGQTTATATGNRNTVRSRSRSPLPAVSGVWQEEGRAKYHEHFSRKEDGDNTRETSLDLHSILPSSSTGSNTNLSAFSSSEDATPTKRGGSSTTLRTRIAAKWEDNKGLLMVVLAMFFSASMGATARLMETGPNPMHTFQILFARMSITMVLSMAYMKWKKIPDFPLGPPGVRKILVARGMGGFFGVFGLYYSVRYLPLGEATVITFLAPMVANYVCSILLKETFSKREQLAGAISLLGVMFIARPTSFFSSATEVVEAPVPGSNSTMGEEASAVSAIPDATPVQRIIAVLASLVGVLGAACAYTTIRWIGKRAHPLISVNYLSVWCTLVSLVALLVLPDVSFRFPADTREWILLLSLGTFGMVMQFFLTAGLSRQKGSAATNMTYTQMIFVLTIDYTLWGTVLIWSSWVGVALILGSQIWGAMARGQALKQNDIDTQIARVPRESVDEEAGLVEGMDQDESDNEESRESRGVEMREFGRRE